MTAKLFGYSCVDYDAPHDVQKSEYIRKEFRNNPVVRQYADVLKRQGVKVVWY